MKWVSDGYGQHISKIGVSVMTYAPSYWAATGQLREPFVLDASVACSEHPTNSYMYYSYTIS
eukprot:COSAG01_NODE_5209_length_4405_cov_4.633558_4_plen_62_part_00